MELLVSILIPTNNRPDLLLKAVKSVLLQSYKNIEIIITDNSDQCGLNNAVTNISDKRIFYTKNEFNIGPVLNWRKALGLAKGKYCILLPDDDFFMNPFYIEDVVGIAEKHKINLVISNCILGYPGRSTIGISGHNGLIKGKEFADKFWRQYSIPTIANLFNRCKALELDAFNSNDILYSDIELWLKLMINEENVFCYSIPSIYYLFHGDNIVMTMTKEALIKNSRFVKASLGPGVDDHAVRTLANRYINFLDSVSNVVSLSIIQGIYKENKLKKGEFELFVKMIIFRYLRQFRLIVKNLIK